jgi:isocitrate/isopropylmalate dehydrogenase
LFDGVPCPLAGRKPSDIDMFIVRENTEGEYSAVRRDVPRHRARIRVAEPRSSAASAASGC